MLRTAIIYAMIDSCIGYVFKSIDSICNQPALPKFRAGDKFNCINLIGDGVQTNFHEVVVIRSSDSFVHFDFYEYTMHRSFREGFYARKFLHMWKGSEHRRTESTIYSDGRIVDNVVHIHVRYSRPERMMVAVDSISRVFK